MTSVASAVKRRLQTTSIRDHAVRVRVTHPFHPLSGQELELVDYRHSWDLDRVFFRDPSQPGRVRTLAAAWTDLVVPDPFLVVAAGRCFCRADDLLQLAELVAALARRKV